MKILDLALNGYENSRLVEYGDVGDEFSNTHYYDELPSREVTGVLKANRYVNGRLCQIYSEKDNHVGIIAATRLGKTTSYVSPSIFSFSHRKNKVSFIASDPKGELYRRHAVALNEEGYEVILVNFRDYLHSECWNPLSGIYKLVIKRQNVEMTVDVVDTPEGPRNRFNGRIYKSQRKLDADIAKMKRIIGEEIGNAIDDIAAAIVTVEKHDDPYWEECARDLFKAFVWALVEDVGAAKTSSKTPVTEETFSISTILKISDSFNDGTDSHYDDHGYFSSRGNASRAYALAHKCILENAPQTRKCIVSSFNAKMSVYRNSAIRLITSCNSFKMEDLVGEKPVAVFIDYHDEIKTHYRVISSFVQSAYNFLIENANSRPEGRLSKPFYFILDEFGNFPAIPDFETVISACGGRNIFFMLILQSYAQLNNVYGEAVAEIIKDNLNMHVFIGSNNPYTLEQFSKECGMRTRFSPISAVNGDSENVERYSIETIPLMPKSKLSALKEGECIVTEANCGYVMFSKLERYYRCKEYTGYPSADYRDYSCSIDPLDDRYSYTLPSKSSSDRYRF